MHSDCSILLHLWPVYNFREIHLCQNLTPTLTCPTPKVHQQCDASCLDLFQVPRDSPLLKISPPPYRSSRALLYPRWRLHTAQICGVQPAVPPLLPHSPCSQVLTCVLSLWALAACLLHICSSQPCYLEKHAQSPLHVPAASMRFFYIHTGEHMEKGKTGTESSLPSNKKLLLRYRLSGRKRTKRRKTQIQGWKYRVHSQPSTSMHSAPEDSTMLGSRYLIKKIISVLNIYRLLLSSLFLHVSTIHTVLTLC